MRGVYYNTAAVIDADGTYLGKYRKQHIPQTSGFWEKYFFKPGDGGYPVFETRYRHDRRLHLLRPPLPRGRALPRPQRRRDRLQPQRHRRRPQPVPVEARAARPRRRQRLLRRRHQPRRHRGPWNIGKFYGTSYFVNPRGQILAQGSEDGDELIIADLDLAQIDEVRKTWQFYRDRRPEAYDELVRPSRVTTPRAARRGSRARRPTGRSCWPSAPASRSTSST
jgi:beta-ureidopropionase